MRGINRTTDIQVDRPGLVCSTSHTLTGCVYYRTIQNMRHTQREALIIVGILSTALGGKPFFLKDPGFD